jgi:hypothetical protein
VTTRRLRNAVLVSLLAATFIGLFPLSVRLADPFFTHPFRAGWQYKSPVLLVWPERVELRWFHNLSEVSPCPKGGGGYTFNVSPERQAWVEERVRNTPSPNGNAAWILHVTQVGPARQKIQLELLGDGITGIVYEARPQEIVPLQSRLAGPAGSFVILGVHLVLWGGCWFTVWCVYCSHRRLLLARTAKV